MNRGFFNSLLDSYTRQSENLSLTFHAADHGDKYVISPRNQRNKIRNPNFDIRNKPKDLNSNYEIRNGLVWNFLIFEHLYLFRVSNL